MFENLLRNSDGRIRQLLTDSVRCAQAIRDWYWASGCTESEARGISLLREWLSSEQLAQFNKHRHFDVTGCHSGKQYRIRYGTGTNVYEIDSDGRAKAGWCFVPNEALVPGDVMLAQKIALETDEWSALAVAKNFMPSWH
jgi:hypothetical protein